MNSNYVNPSSIFNNPASDGVDYSHLVDFNDDSAQDSLFWGKDNNDDWMLDYNPTAPIQQSCQDTTAAAQQQLIDSIPAADISNESFTAQLQLGNGYNSATSFPFPTQAAPQNVETPNTAPSTSRSPESSPQNNDSPSSNNTTSPEANPPSPVKGPKKRGRKPKVPKDKAEGDQIRKNFLERNRIAASKCREKRKEEIETMQRNVHTLKQQNTRLKDEVAWFQGYVDFLMEAFRPHVDAKCLHAKATEAAMIRREMKFGDKKKASREASLDLDGMSYETEDDELKMKERQISVDSGVADLSTPTQAMPANPFGATKIS